MSAYINAIATGVPGHEMHHLFDDYALRRLDERMRRFFVRANKKSGIERRYTVVEPRARTAAPVSLDAAGTYAFDAFPSTGQRMAIYDREAAPLAARTAAGLGERLEGVTHLVVCSCTGFAAPGVDLQLLERLGLPLTTQRTLIGFMGCYAAINALRVAAAIVGSEPGARVLTVAVELCTLHMQESDNVEALLSFMIFGDGCAAALVSAEPEGARIDGFATALMPAARDLITWHIGDLGFDMRLSTNVPAVLGEQLPDATRALLPSGANTTELWAIHPGGKAILDAAEKALDLPADALDASRHVLRNYGNMSSPSVLFVLAELLARRPPSGTEGLALAFGPGLTAEGMRFSAA